MIKREWLGSYTDPKTGLKVVMVKTTDEKIHGVIKITNLLKVTK